MLFTGQWGGCQDRSRETSVQNYSLMAMSLLSSIEGITKESRWIGSKEIQWTGSLPTYIAKENQNAVGPVQ